MWGAILELLAKTVSFLTKRQELVNESDIKESKKAQQEQDFVDKIRKTINKRDENEIRKDLSE